MALRIARAMGPHAFAEGFPLPTARDVVRVMIGNMTLNQTKGSSWSFLWEVRTCLKNFFVFNLPDTPLVLARSPFTAKVEYVPEEAKMTSMKLLTEMRGELISLQCRLQGSGSCDCSCTYSVWVAVVPFPFPTTHLCGTGFSSSLVFTSTYRNRFVVGRGLGCTLLQRLSGNFWLGEKEATSAFTPMLDVYTHCGNAVCVVYCCHIKTVTHATPCFRTKLHLFVIRNKYSMI